MARPSIRDNETRALIQRFQARRDRRRKLQLLFTGLGIVVVLALVAAVVVLVLRGPTDENEMAATTTLQKESAISVASSDTSTTEKGAAIAGSTIADTTVQITSTEGGPDSTTPSTTTTTGDTSTTATTTATTVSEAATTITTQAAASTASSQGFIVVIDPGHQAKADSSTEPIGPGSSNMKAKVSSGTAGVATGTPESVLVLTVALKLRDALVSHGVEVVMTRTTQEVSISNIQRAQIANDAGADLFVRIHADGSSNAATSGIHVLYPASVKGWTDDIAAASKEAATLAQKELIAATGAKDRGIDARSDITGFNWSDVPVILPEIGFMTNPDEDRLLGTPAYQDKIVQGLTRAILSFLGVS